MKKILILGLIVVALSVALSACAYHTKQPVDDNYYKKTQTVGWPE